MNYRLRVLHRGNREPQEGFKKSVNGKQNGGWDFSGKSRSEADIHKVMGEEGLS